MEVLMIERRMLLGGAMGVDGRMMRTTPLLKTYLFSIKQ